MPETIESETITPEQRTWANAILKISGGGSTGTPTPTVENREGGKIKNTYGKGLKGSILLDGRPIPQVYTNALTKGAKMISKDDWVSAMQGRKPSNDDLSKLVKEREQIVQKLKDTREKRKELSDQITRCNDFYAKWEKIGSAPSLDLSSMGLGSVPSGELSAKYQIEVNKYNSLKSEVDTLESESGQSLIALDSPDDNPEHLEIAEGLKDLEDLESKYPTPRSGDAEKEYIKHKSELLYGLQSVVFKWNDRRTSENLPSSGDAVAMADMIQRMHLEMMDDVIKKGLPMPLSFENEILLSKEEKEKIQETWKKLVESKDTGSQPGNRLVVGVPVVDNKFVNNDTEAQEFRIQTLANLSRLMQSPGGRGLIDEINKGTNKVDFTAGEYAACTGYGVNTAVRGVGGRATVKMVMGAKDSDVSLSTRTGGALFAPRFIAMAHEMVHALHNAQGRNRVGVPLVHDDVWNNSEEYQTISKGKYSEQTIRQQYGLSAERFGHKVPPVTDEVYNAVDEKIKAAEELLKRDPKIVDGMLKQRGFDPTKIPTKLKLEISDSSLKGPVPLGWELSQLTFKQLEEILKDPSLDHHLHEYSWTPYGLDRKRMEEIHTNKEHHPRSPNGIRMRALGGLGALSTFGPFETKTGFKLPQPTGSTWEDKLTAMEGANDVLVDLAKSHDAPEIRTAAQGQAKLQKRLAKVTEAYELYEQKLVAHGGDAALDEIAGYNQHVANKKLAVDRADLFTKVKTLDEAVKWLAVDHKLVPSSLKSSVTSGTTGAKIKATAELWKTTKEEIEQLGGFSTRSMATIYNRTLGRSLALSTKGDLFSVLDLLKLTQTDLAKLKSETKSDLLKSAISGSNLASDLAAALKAFKEMQLLFASYGGLAGHSAIPAIGKLAGVTLEAKEVELSGQIVECKAAAEAFLKYATESGDPETLSIVKSKGTLSGKVTLIEKAQQRKEATTNLASSQEEKSEEMEEQGIAMGVPFESSKVDKAEQNVKASNSAVKAVTDAYREVSDALASLPGSATALIPALDELEKQAKDYLQGHKNPWTDIGQKRQTLCEDLLKIVDDTRNLYNSVQAKAREAITELKELAKDPDSLSLSAVDGLAVIANNPYLSVEAQRELADAISEIADLIDKATLKRESELA